MRLPDFIAANVEPILAEWETFARGIGPGADMDALALRDHAGDILLATVRDMRAVRGRAERDGEPGGHAGGDGKATLNGASEQHAVGRLGSGFDLLEVVSEYRALRASVLRLWHESRPGPHDADADDVTRFNELIDQSLVKAVGSYTKRVDQSRDLFLAILGHDLRNPLNSIAMSAALLPQLIGPAGEAGGEAADVTSQIATNADVMARMIGDLLDYTRTRLGAGMPVHPAPTDLGALCRALFHEFRTAHPARTIRYDAEGELTGHWDADRLRQLVSNLIGNAIQHSPDGALVELRVTGEAADVVLVVRNEGPAIPDADLARIFDPLAQGSGRPEPRRNRPGSIGLGLFIAREIAQSHGGTIDVTSSAGAGTAFTVRLPRHHLVASGAPILAHEPPRTA
jgi:signal transduction histidine kinase